jgi:uncharacterized protein YydD (DUF2326 family)
MPQLKLLKKPKLEIIPEEGRTAPRLWIRRLVIWEEPGKFIRDISLKPGLNIIWSPDPGEVQLGDDNQTIGHGSGKSTFCRLLRYCLGEDSFAPEIQRDAILTRFPKGCVGAEVLLDGQLWVVVRFFDGRIQDIVVENGSFDFAFQEGTEGTTINPLRKAIAASILGSAAKLMPQSIETYDAWQAALAWLTRDQECRFSKPLEWRSPDSKSNSPVQGLSTDDLLTIVRALIKAGSFKELEAKEKERKEAKNLDVYHSELTRLESYCERVRSELDSFFGVDQTSGSQLDLEGLKTAIYQNYMKSMSLPDNSSTANLDTARQARDKAREKFNALESQLNETIIREEEKNNQLSLMRAERPNTYAKLMKGENPVCMVCEVPIDKALAEGCSISHASYDPKIIQERIQKLNVQISYMEREIKELHNKKPGFENSIKQLKQGLKPLEDAVRIIEAALYERSQSVRTAQRYMDNIERYESLIAEKEKLKEKISTTSYNLKKIREALSEHRKSVSRTIRKISAKFDAIFRELVPVNVSGLIKLDGNGLALEIEHGGKCTTAALESLKVVAFDLAVLAMTMEGQTYLPAFLLHDSPREADLGFSLYSRVFDLASRFEQSVPSPLFQYIITTTTSPPKQYQSDEWVRLVIHGSPARERMLRVDL